MAISVRLAVQVLLASSFCITLPAAAQIQPQGLEPPWDARKVVDAVVKNDQQLKPLLGAINPQEWYEKKGAASTYVIQWQTAQRQLDDVEVTANRVSQRPDSLPLVLDLYFRLEALETSARSVNEGAKNYADRSTADALAKLVAGSFDARQRLREYIRNLSADLEQNFKIADGEAQRCRGMISREPLPSRKRKSN
jgi:hypothetical protein